MEDSLKNTLNKKERIKGNKRIDSLFLSGEAFISYPLRVVFLRKENIDSQPPISMMVSVSKKRFKRAVKRNRMKRIIREAFRLNKAQFYSICKQNEINLDIAFLYLKNELSDYKEIEKALLKTIVILENKITEKRKDA